MKKGKTHIALLLTEGILLFFGVPLLMFFDRGFIHPSAILLPALLLILLILRKTDGFRFTELIRLGISNREWLKNIMIVIAAALLMIIAVYLFDRENLFNLPKGNWKIWVLLCTFYPVFSSYLQEILYRTYLYRRYRSILTSRILFILVSGITFSFAHILYYSPVSIILTFIGGLYLADVYYRTQSVLFTSILHGLLGIAIFSSGLGQYFWLDMMQWLQ